MSRSISYTVSRSLPSSSYQTAQEEESSSSSSDSDSDDDLDIHEIVRQGNLAEIKEAISRDRPKYIALKDKFGKTALHYAVETSNERAALFLIAKCANINAKDNKELTPLHHAAARGLSDMCRFLLDFQANIRAKDVNCWTALHHAVDGNHIDTATLLIKRGVDIHAEDHRFGRTCLHLAAELGYTDMCEMLIIRGADLCATGDAFFSKTPLHIACLHGHVDCAAVLVRKGADVNALSGLLDKAPLHFAAEEGHVDCVKLLLRANADPNRHGNHSYGYTPLHIAVVKDHWHVVEAFLEGEKQYGVNLNLPGRFSIEGSTAMHLACQFGHTHIIQLLLDTTSVNREAEDVNRRTPLHIACKYGHYGIADLMMEISGCNYKAKALDGKTPIDLIKDPVEKDRLKLLCYKLDLLKKYENEQLNRRKEVEAQRRADEEAIVAAREREKAEAVRLAAERRLQWRKQLTMVSDVAGEIDSFQRIAAEHLDQDINEMLVEISEDDKRRFYHLRTRDALTLVRHSTLDTGIDLPAITQSRAITRAAYRGFYDLVQALLHWRNIEIDFQETETGNTALHYAASFGFRDIVELLLLHGAKNYLMNAKGQVPANLAPTSALREIIRNARLIAKRHMFQDAVLEEIYHRQSLLPHSHQPQTESSETKRKTNGAVGAEAGGEVSLGVVVFEENLSQPETLRHIIETTSPMRTNAPGESAREFAALNQLHASPHKTSSLKLPLLSLGKSDNLTSPVPSATASGGNNTFFPSMGPQNGANFSPNFRYPSAAERHLASSASIHSMGGVNSSQLSRQELELEQQRAHVPFAQRVYKDRQGFIEAVASMNDGQATLPPVRGPLAMHELDNHQHAWDDASVSVHSATMDSNALRETTAAAMAKVAQEESALQAVEEFVEVSFATFLAHHYDLTQQQSHCRPKSASKASKRLQKKLQTKFGMIPVSFGGCRRDLFFTALRAGKYQQPAVFRFGEETYSSVFHLQGSYLPTAFDQSDEFEDVRDFLWLLGQPFHVAMLQSMKETDESSPLATESAQQQQQQHIQQQQQQNRYNKQVLLSECFKGFESEIAARRDKRSFLYDMAVAMNRLQSLFTRPTAIQPSNDSSNLRQFLIEQVLMHQRRSTASTDDPDSASAFNEMVSLPKNLPSEDLPDLHQFVSICRDFLTIFLTVYDTNFPAYLESCVASSAQTAPGDGDTNPEKVTDDGSNLRVRLTLEQERLVIQALRDEIFYLQQYGFLDEALVSLLHTQLLPCCTLFALEFLLGTEQSPYASAAPINKTLPSSTQGQKKNLSFREPISSSSMRTSSPETKHKDKEQVDDDDDGGSVMKSDPMKALWAGMLLNPPRMRRQAIDVVYELAAFLVQQAEISYPQDAIRAHLWAQQARQLLLEYQSNTTGSTALAIASASAAIEAGAATAVTRNPEDMEKEHGCHGRLSTEMVAPPATKTALQLWLDELALTEYEKYFVGLGFRLLEDFQELNEEDCYRYFPFIKVGDMRRLAKRCDQLTDGIVRQFHLKANKLAAAKAKAQQQKQQEQLQLKAPTATTAITPVQAAISTDDVKRETTVEVDDGASVQQLSELPDECNSARSNHTLLPSLCGSPRLFGQQSMEEIY